MRGWLDNYHRWYPNQEEVDVAISSLIDKGLLIKTENKYQASEEVKTIWKTSRCWLKDAFGLKLSTSTRSRFAEALIKKTVTTENFLMKSKANKKRHHFIAYY